MAHFDVQWLQMIVGIIVYFLFSMAWFIVLTPQWAAGLGMSREQHAESMKSRNMPVVAAVQMVLNILTAGAVYYLVVDVAGATTTVHGLLYGLVIALVAVTMHAGALWYENRPFGLQVIYGGHKFIALAILGALLGGWH